MGRRKGGLPAVCSPRPPHPLHACVSGEECVGFLWGISASYPTGLLKMVPIEAWGWGWQDGMWVGKMDLQRVIQDYPAMGKNWSLDLWPCTELGLFTPRPGSPTRIAGFNIPDIDLMSSILWGPGKICMDVFYGKMCMERWLALSLIFPPFNSMSQTQMSLG